MPTDLLPPRAPDLSETWIALRRGHLVAEVTPKGSRRPTRRLAITGVAALAASSVAIVISLAGPGVPDAFAGWTAAPTQPGTGQLTAAAASCQQAFSAVDPPGATGGSDGGAGLPPVVLSDTRGPFALLVYADSTATDLCISGSNFVSVHLGSATNISIPSPDGIVVDRTSFTSGDGTPYTLIEGQAGSNVTAATLNLSDGTSVETTMKNGLFVAWWPSQTGVSSALVVTSSGVTSQQLNISRPIHDQVSPGNGSTGVSNRDSGTTRKSHVQVSPGN